MNKSIQICNNCKKPITINDRFCYNCGIYLGEPASNDENGINRFAEEAIINEANYVEGSKADLTNKSAERFNSLIKAVYGMMINPLYNIQTIPLKSGYILTISATLFYILTQSILYLTFSTLVFDSPQRLIKRFFNITLAYVPNTFAGLAVNAVSISALLIIVLFSSIYLISSLAFDSYGKLMTLWNVVILSQMPNLLGLAVLQLIWSFNEFLAVSSVIIFFTVSTIVLFKGTLNTLKGDESKTAYTVAFGYVLAYLGFIGYLKAFLG